jgi:CubicO group peptidase (beta-lactamase class C family)
MKKFMFLLFLLVSCGKDSNGQSSLSSISNLLPNYSIPALGAAYMHNGLMEEITISGVRKIDSPVLAQADDAFHLGSNSKAMTATLAAIFIENGKLDWTTPVGTLLPELDLNPQYKTMTFETLLVHRGGLPAEHNDLFNRVLKMDPVLGRALITQTLLKATPQAPPGSTYLYSNFNYIIAGHILERLGNKSWEDLLREKLFIPLEMNTCGFGVTSVASDVQPSSIWAHVVVKDIVTPKHYDNPLTYGPASSVHCSLRDWGKFNNLHVQGWRGESHFLKLETFKKLHSTHPSHDSDYTYGGWLLLNRSWAKGAVLTHAGSNLMNYSNVWIAPNLNAVFMSTANIGGESAFAATDAAVGKLITKFQNLP